MDFTQQQISILIVDDDPLMHRMLEKVLRDGAPTWKVSCVESGREALNHIESTSTTDIIICDLNMPQMNGYELLEHLRADRTTSDIPLILLTAMRSPESQRRGMNLGADDFLMKPVSSEQLITAINARLTKSRSQTQRTQEKLNDLRRSITLSLPHELRTPLSALTGFAELLSINDPPMEPESVKKYGSIMLGAANRLHRVVENYIAYSQLELFVRDPEKVAAMREKRLDEIKQKIDLLIDQKCPPIDRPSSNVLIDGDPVLCISETYFNRALTEILDNAIKFSPSSSQILVYGEQKGDNFEISITDYGEGMSQQTIQSLDAFYQFNREKREQQGLGLGLHLAKALVEIHGGQLKIESEVGSFTCVTISLPTA